MLFVYRNVETFEPTHRLGLNGAGQVGGPAIRLDLFSMVDPNRDTGIVHVNDPGVDPLALAYFLEREEYMGGPLLDVAKTAILKDGRQRTVRVLGLEPDQAAGVLKARLEVTDTDLESGDGRSKEVNRVFKVTSEQNPENIGWRRSEVATVVDSTGAFNTPTKARRHLQGENAAERVLLTAPISDDPEGQVPTLVRGFNMDHFQRAIHTIVANGSCTLKNLVACLRVLLQMGMISGTAGTVHSLTQGDQSALYRPRTNFMERGRPGVASIVPTKTGAGADVLKLFEQLEGKFAVEATRVPVEEGANVSFSVDIPMQPGEELTAAKVNGFFRQQAAGPMQGLLAVIDTPMTNWDVMGRTEQAILQANKTQVLQGPPGHYRVMLTAWYANRAIGAGDGLGMAEYMDKATA